MVNNISKYNVSFFVTHFTQRMCLDIAVTNLLPLMPIAFAWLIFSVVTLIPFILGTLMLLTVSTVRQLGATGIAAWFLRFSRHYFSPRCFGYKKGPAQRQPCKPFSRQDYYNEIITRTFFVALFVLQTSTFTVYHITSV